MAGNGYDDGLLLTDAKREPHDTSTANLIGQPSVLGHFIAALGVAAAGLTRPVRVLDFGGGTGGYYGIARSTFGSSIQFDWTVVEQPLYVNYGREFIRTPGLRFAMSAPDEDFDLVCLSGVLQYLPQLDTALNAKILRAPMVYIARTIVEDDEQAYLQIATYDVGAMRMPARIISRDALLNRMRALGYAQHASWHDETWFIDKRVASPSMLFVRRL